jgi:hypothetical protein
MLLCTVKRYAFTTSIDTLQVITKVLVVILYPHSKASSTSFIYHPETNNTLPLFIRSASTDSKQSSLQLVNVLQRSIPIKTEPASRVISDLWPIDQPTNAITQKVSREQPRARCTDMPSPILVTTYLPHILSTATSLLSSPPPSQARSPLSPRGGAPLIGDPNLVPARYLTSVEKYDEEDGLSAHSTPSESAAQTSSLNPHPSRDAPPQPGARTRAAPPIYLVRSPPSQLLDAPARAALSMPNAQTAHAQARVVRGPLGTPDYAVDSNAGVLGLSTSPHSNRGLNDRQDENVPLLAPTPRYAGQADGRPPISRSSSAASTSSTRGILRRIFIDRATTPSQHLSRPTFPPPSLSTYSPQPLAALSIRAQLDLVVIQTMSLLISTVFLTFVTGWALSAELARALPRWAWPDTPKKFPWDDDGYWKKEGKKISKEPKDYARQVGMDIENQTVETEDGYYLRWVPLSAGHQVYIAAADMAGCTRSLTPMLNLTLMAEVSPLLVWCALV